uniref:Uncharacterized protein n=1 Tax=Anguilla anguilla TaxID=7936 RepID=A0A0E9XFU2_ANGAN
MLTVSSIKYVAVKIPSRCIGMALLYCHFLFSHGFDSPLFLHNVHLLDKEGFDYNFCFLITCIFNLCHLTIF